MAQNSSNVPAHVAIIMDGNGRWANARHLPRHAGHKAGVDAVERVVNACDERGIKALTLFAFSSENWRRPKEEVSLLMNLFLTALRSRIRKMHERGVRLSIIGDRAMLGKNLLGVIDEAEALTRDNKGLHLVVAASYGGRWDIVEATRRIAAGVAGGSIEVGEIDEAMLAGHLALADLPEPDLFIRTGGESRISNFLLWHLAYTELYFTESLWPEFDDRKFSEALEWYAGRQRRFGRTTQQLVKEVDQTKRVGAQDA